MTDKYLTEALRRLGEVESIIQSDLLSGKAKLNTVQELFKNYYYSEAYTEEGQDIHCSNLYFGESRVSTNLKGKIPKVKLNIQVDVQDSKHKK